MKNWTIARRIIVGGASIIVLADRGWRSPRVVSLRQITKEAVSIKENSSTGPEREQHDEHRFSRRALSCAPSSPGEAPNNEERETFLKQLDDLTATSNVAFDAYAKRIIDSEDRENFRIPDRESARSFPQDPGRFRRPSSAPTRTRRQTSSSTTSWSRPRWSIPRPGTFWSITTCAWPNSRRRKSSTNTAATIWTVATVAVLALLAGVAFGRRGHPVAVSKNCVRSPGAGSGADQVTCAPPRRFHIQPVARAGRQRTGRLARGNQRFA